MKPGTVIHCHADKEWTKGELRRCGPAEVFGRPDITLEEALQLVDDCPTEYLPVGRCDNRDERGICRGHEPPDDHVSFPSDDEPEGPECPRLHVLGGMDYCLSVHPGERWPSTHAFRANTSGARDVRVTFLVAALYKLGREDLDGAVACARAFVEEVDSRTPPTDVKRAPDQEAPRG